MPEPFQAFGPFEFDKTRIELNEYVAEWWEGIDHQMPGLSAAHGVYLISLRNGENFVPIYVGMTKNSRGFIGETMNDRNRLAIIREVRSRKGVGVVHLIARPRPHRSGFSVNISREKLEWMERFVILHALRKNEDLANIKGISFIEEIAIANVTGKWARGHATLAVTTLKNALDLNEKSRRETPVRDAIADPAGLA
jgi:hypothetical protein